MSATIHSLQALPEGRMLIGTSRGLNLWDGQRLIGYSAGHGLARGRITCAIEHRGEIWAGSWGGGLSELRDNVWRTLRAGDSPLPGDWISALASDRNALWVATYGGGLAVQRQGQWRVYTRESSPLPSDWLTALAVDRDGGLWVGTERAGLAHRAADGQWSQLDLPFKGQTEVTALLSDGDTIWVGTPGGLAILDAGTMQWRAGATAASLPGDHISALALGPEGHVWIGTSQGLAMARRASLTGVIPDISLWHPAVSALAVDSYGDVWVGGPVRGVAKQGVLHQPEISRLPIMLVHGWRGPDSDLLRDSEFSHLARWLEQDGFESHYVSGISPENTLHQNAARLRDAIAKVRQQTGAEQVVVIAFSMGGLNSRAYLESSLYGQDVRRAFILGTPHRGEHLWLPFLVWERLAWTDEPSALELFPIQTRLFGRAHSNVWSVPYTVIAGDARGEPLPTLFRELPASDGLVSTWSALGVQGQAVTHHVTTDIHAWSDETILLDLPSLLLPRSTYDAFIRPYLFGASDAPGARGALDEKDYSELRLPPRTGLRAAQVRPGETAALAPWPIDGVRRTRFYVRWKGPSLDVRLRAPDRTEIDPDFALEDLDSEYLALGFADFASFVITDTLPGPWQLVAESAAENVEISDLVAYATLDSPLELSLSTDREWYTPREQIGISALVRDPEAHAQTSAASCTIYAPNGRRETIRLSASADATLAPGALQGSYQLSDLPGYYVLDCRVLGDRLGQHFERSELALVGVATQKAFLDGEPLLRLKGRKGAAQGGAHAEVGVSVQVAGDYLVSVSLGNLEGSEPMQIAHPVSLSPGDQTVLVPIPLEAPALRSLGQSYKLLDVTLLDISDAGLLADYWAPGQAAAEQLQ